MEMFLNSQSGFQRRLLRGANPRIAMRANFAGERPQVQPRNFED